jgi:hypothetical protein
VSDTDRRLVKAPKLPKDVRDARLEAAMRANLHRRKDQARAKAAAERDASDASPPTPPVVGPSGDDGRG